MLTRKNNKEKFLGVFNLGIKSSTTAEEGKFYKPVTLPEQIGFGELLTRAEKTLTEKREKIKKTGRPTVYPSFGEDMKTMTEFFGGIQPGMYALGGEPGLGKTFMALFLAHRYLIAEKDTCVVWVDVSETRPVDLLATRMACIHTRKNPYIFERALAEPKEFADIASTALAAIGDRFTIVEAKQNTTIAHIRAVVYKLMVRTKAKHCMVVLDFVQKFAQFAAGGIYSDIRQRVIHVVAAMTELVKNTNGPVILVSSLSKGAYRRGITDASIADFKETGDVEYTVDAGIQLRWADDTRNQEKDSAVKVLDAWIVKNRWGPTGKVRLFSVRTEARYTETDPGDIKMPHLLHDDEIGELLLDLIDDSKELPF
ncbi:DnaB-like helicase C-terminal domain-containing protein [Desulforamulus putei]|uniref:DnaB-like helicase C-terminal domain-containing protein n=1 Tax=Desulforamulus putei TaxID=74701 RepID=UPI0013565C9F|nr:DnaB-like helicase C-terminal domain-containing protein [Desulforamulus putei]